jgi:hypothetical protein
MRAVSTAHSLCWCIKVQEKYVRSISYIIFCKIPRTTSRLLMPIFVIYLYWLASCHLLACCFDLSTCYYFTYLFCGCIISHICSCHLLASSTRDMVIRSFSLICPILLFMNARSHFAAMVSYYYVLM